MKLGLPTARLVLALALPFVLLLAAAPHAGGQQAPAPTGDVAGPEGADDEALPQAPSGGDAADASAVDVGPAAATAAPAVELSPKQQAAVAAAARAEPVRVLSEDASLAQRLRLILAAVDEGGGMRAKVEAGIVVLTGEARSREEANQAVDLARKLPGVLAVIDELRVRSGLGARLSQAWRRALDRLADLGASLPLVGTALVLVALAWLLARLLRDARFLYVFVGERELLRNLLRQAVFVATLLAGVFMALHLLEAGAIIGTVLGAAGVVGIAMGFAFRNVIESYIAGVLLAVRQPFRPRDLVEIDGNLGTVLRMTASETILMDANGNHLRLPNAAVFNGTVLNYTRNPLRRLKVSVGVGTAVDLHRAQELGVSILQRMKGVIDDPAPSATIATLGDSSVTLEFFGWVDQRTASFVKARSEAHRLIKEAFDEAGVDMPAPSYNVLLERTGGGPDARGGVAAPTPRADGGGNAPEEVDVTPGSDIEDQVDAEIAASREEDLLEKGAEDDERPPPAG